MRRREFLRWTTAAAGLAALPGCERGFDFLNRRVPDGLPETLDLAAGTRPSPEFHLLQRAAFGPRPGDVARAGELGTAAWIDEQLAWRDVSDVALESALLQFESVFDDPSDLLSVKNAVIREHLDRSALMRAVHTRRQLHEVMTHFWTDHLSIDVGKRLCTETKPLDDLTVVREHALGRFRDLIRASALSPAMLVYLDGRENRRRTPDEQPNENYARELLELHTLGVHGGYTQHDVMEAARCLTGWTFRESDSLGDVFALLSGTALLRKDEGRRKIRRAFEPVFRPEWHDDGAKTVLGTKIPAGGGAADLDALLDVVCTHPSTAQHVARKLCRRLVSPEPSDELVRSSAAVFTETSGEIEPVVRHVLTSEEFAASVNSKMKRPFRYVASALRSLGARSVASRREIASLERLGHVPHHYPTPDGYPDEAEPWTGTLLWRWNFALDLVSGRLGKTEVDLRGLAERAGLDPKTVSPAGLAPLFFGRRASSVETVAVDDYVAGSAAGGVRREAVALLLSAPGFQVH